MRVVASALNHIDLWMTQGMPRPRSFPHVPGSDGAGYVDELGEGVTRWSVGDPVVISTAITSDEADDRLGIDSPFDPSLQLLGEHRWGAHGERVVVPERALVAKPTCLSWSQAASYPCAYTTAWRMLRRGRLRPNERVLITGIGGGVALAALHLAKAQGAQVVVSSRDADKCERALKLGADEAVQFEEVVQPGVDLVIDSIGSAIWKTATKSMKPGARFVTCGGSSGPKLEVSLPQLFFKQFELIGSTLGSYQEFEQVTEHIAHGVEVPVASEFAFEDYLAALEFLRESRQFGKVVLTRS